MDNQIASIINSYRTELNRLRRQRRNIINNTTMVQNFETEVKSITFDNTFNNQFNVVSSSLMVQNGLVNLTVEASKINSNTLLNTQYLVGTIPDDCIPSTNISGLFPYSNTFNNSDIGQIHVNSDGSLTIRTGANTAMNVGTNFTFSILYLI